MTTQDASYATIQELSAKRRKENHRNNDQHNPSSFDTLAPRAGNGNGNSQRQQRNGKKNHISTNPTTANASDAEGNSDTNPLTQTDGGADPALLSDTNDIFLTAPAMDRTLSTNTSNNIYSTRSTRHTHPLSHLPHLPFSSSSPLNNLGPLAGRAAAIRLLGSYTKERKQAGEEYNRAPGLTEQEMDDDFAMIANAFDQGKRAWNGRLAEEVAGGNGGDWVGDGQTVGKEKVSFLRGGGSGSEGEEGG